MINKVDGRQRLMSGLWFDSLSRWEICYRCPDICQQFIHEEGGLHYLL